MAAGAVVEGASGRGRREAGFAQIVVTTFDGDVAVELVTTEELVAGVFFVAAETAGRAVGAQQAVRNTGLVHLGTGFTGGHATVEETGFLVLTRRLGRSRCGGDRKDGECQCTEGVTGFHVGLSRDCELRLHEGNLQRRRTCERRAFRCLTRF
ncbi:hypothetical protein FQZ97_967980 [compost metagenome]